MIQSFSDYLNKREWYGGEAGAPSFASEQPDGYGGPVPTTAMPSYSEDDKPPVKKPKKKNKKPSF